jgi:hypothetical protein
MNTPVEAEPAAKERRRGGTRPFFLFAVMVGTISSAGVVATFMTDLLGQARMAARVSGVGIRPADAFLYDHPLVLTLPVVVALLSAVPVAVRKGDLWWQAHALLTALIAIIIVAWVVDVVLGGMVTQHAAAARP